MNYNYDTVQSHSEYPENPENSKKEKKSETGKLGSFTFIRNVRNYIRELENESKDMPIPTAKTFETSEGNKSLKGSEIKEKSKLKKLQNFIDKLIVKATKNYPEFDSRNAPNEEHPDEKIELHDLFHTFEATNEPTKYKSIKLSFRSISSLVDNYLSRNDNKTQSSSSEDKSIHEKHKAQEVKGSENKEIKFLRILSQLIGDITEKGEKAAEDNTQTDTIPHYTATYESEKSVQDVPTDLPPPPPTGSAPSHSLPEVPVTPPPSTSPPDIPNSPPPGSDHRLRGLPKTPPSPPEISQISSSAIQKTPLDHLTNELEVTERNFSNELKYIVNLAIFMKNNRPVKADNKGNVEEGNTPIDNAIKALKTAVEVSDKFATDLENPNITSFDKVCIYASDEYTKYLESVKNIVTYKELLLDELNAYRELISLNQELKDKFYDEVLSKTADGKHELRTPDAIISVLQQRIPRHELFLKDIIDPNKKWASQMQSHLEELNVAFLKTQTVSVISNTKMKLNELNNQIQAASKILKFAQLHLPRDRYRLLKSKIDDFEYKTELVGIAAKKMSEKIDNVKDSILTKGILDSWEENQAITDYYTFLKSQKVLHTTEMLILDIASSSDRKTLKRLKEEYNKHTHAI